MSLVGTPPLARWGVFLASRMGLSKKYHPWRGKIFKTLYVVVSIKLFHSRKRANFKSF